MQEKIEYARVTDILKPFTPFKNMSEPAIDAQESAWRRTVQKAAARGTTVHAICAAIANDEWVPCDIIPQEAKGYVESFHAWMKDRVEMFLVIETRYSDDKQEYTGQVDFIALYKDGRCVLVDIKTTYKPEKTHPIQVAAYSQLAELHGCHVDAVSLVYLSKEGKYPKCFEYEEDELELRRDVFNSALNCYKYFNSTQRRHGKTKPVSEDLGDNERVGLCAEG